MTYSFLRTLNSYFLGVLVFCYFIISCRAAVDHLTRTHLVFTIMSRFYLFSVWAPVHWICSVQCIGCYLKDVLYIRS
jgi:hypothetical protein